VPHRRFAQALLVVVVSGLLVWLPVPAAGAAPPANDLIETATPIPELPFSATQDPAEATRSHGDPHACTLLGAGTMWFGPYTAPADGFVKLNLTSASPHFRVTLQEGRPGSLAEIGCADVGRPALQSVIGGHTYYLMVVSYGLIDLFTLEVSVPNPPANDLIENATPIPQLPFSVIENATDATPSPTDPRTSCHLGPGESTVWYGPYTAPADGLIKLRGLPGVVLFEGAPGALTEIGCTSGGRSPIVPVTSGAHYYVAAYLTIFSDLVFFDLSVPAPPANDLIENAAEITQLPFAVQEGPVDATASASDPPSSCVFSPATPTVWYRYASPDDQAINIDGSTRVTAYEARPSGLVEIGCTGAGAPRALALERGSTYYFMASFTPDQFLHFSVNPASAPANDLIENATPIGDLPYAVSQETTDATISSDDSDQGCGPASAGSVWYAYTAPADGAVRLDGFGPTFGIAAYEGGPESRTLVGCGFNGPVAIAVRGGATYHFMFSVAFYGTLDVSVTAMSPPANDLIENASPVALGTSVSQDSTDATTDPTDPQGCAGSTPSPNVWYSYTPPTGGAVRVNLTAGLFVGVYTGAPGSLVEAGCGSSLLVRVEADTTLYFMLAADRFAPGTIGFELQAASPPVNDDFAQATVVDVLPFSDRVDITDATHEPGEPAGCNASGSSVWYRVTAESDRGLRVDTRTSAAFSIINVYVGTGLHDLSLVGCQNAMDIPLQFDTIRGSTYFIQVVPFSGGEVVVNVETADRTPPVLTIPSDITVEAVDGSGAVVTFAATAWDIVDPNPAVSCSVASGSVFPLGTTEVTCSATDFFGNTSAPQSFDVDVVDTTAPALEVPADINVETTGHSGSVVEYTVSATDTVDPSPIVNCGPASGSVFPIGRTVVRCTATDASGNRSPSATFRVTVVDLRLELSVSPSIATTGTDVVASFSLTNLGPVRRTVSTRLTFAFTTPGHPGITFSTRELSFTMQRGQEIDRTVTFTVIRLMPRGTYELTVTASDVAGSVTRSAALTVVPRGTLVPTDLGTLGGSWSTAVGLNDAGQVVGISGTTRDVESHAFSWTADGGIVDLGTLGGTTSEAVAVSEAGQVVGTSSTADGTTHAFSWTAGGGMVDLGTLGGPNSWASGVNADGQVVGFSDLPDGAQHAFSWTAADGMVDLGTLGGLHSWARGVTADGQVVGESLTTGNSFVHAFAWTTIDGMVDLGTLGGSYSAVKGVDSAGPVVGDSITTGDAAFHAFSWTEAGGMVDVGTLGGSHSFAAAGNARGQVVGNSNLPGDTNDHAFSWTAAEGLIDIGSHGGPSRATDVNAGGLVVGFSWTADFSQQRAFVWSRTGGMSPLIEPPSSHVCAAVGINSAGLVAGQCDTPSTHAVLWTFV
jgi:probable HAF family extracellular repeat protein